MRTTDSLVISETLLPRRRRPAHCGPIALALGMLLMLAACQVPSLPKSIPPTQPAPELSLPPAEILGGPLRAETAEPPPGSLISGGVVTQTDLDSRIRVGLLLPLSGPQARLGQALLKRSSARKVMSARLPMGVAIR